jgi:hypothetical protein
VFPDEVEDEFPLAAGVGGADDLLRGLQKLLDDGEQLRGESQRMLPWTTNGMWRGGFTAEDSPDDVECGSREPRHLIFDPF